MTPPLLRPPLLALCALGALVVAGAPGPRSTASGTFEALPLDLRLRIGAHLDLQSVVRWAATSRMLQAELRLVDTDQVLFNTVFGSILVDDHLPVVIDALVARLAASPALQARLGAVTEEDFCLLYDRIMSLRRPPAVLYALLDRFKFLPLAADLFASLEAAAENGSRDGSTVPVTLDADRVGALRQLGVADAVVRSLTTPGLNSASIQFIAVRGFRRAGQADRLADRAVVLALLRAGLRLNLEAILFDVAVPPARLTAIFPLLNSFWWLNRRGVKLQSLAFVKMFRQLLLPESVTPIEAVWALPPVRDLVRARITYIARECAQQRSLLEELHRLRFPWIADLCARVVVAAAAANGDDDDIGGLARTML